MDGNLTTSDGITIEDNGSVLKVPDFSASSRHIVFSQAKGKPLCESLPCFQVEIIHQAKDACVALGVSKECYLDADAVKDDEQEEKAADKKPDAVAYFGDDGSVSSPASDSTREHLPTFGQGDTITFYLDYQLKEKSLICILKNSQLICRRWVTLSPDCVLPTINVWWGPAELKVKWQGGLNFLPAHDNLEHWRIPDTVTVTDNKLLMRNSHQITTVQSPICFDDNFKYFEVKILSMGENGGKGPVIGLSAAIYKQSKNPGTSYESVGFVASEGYVYHDKRIHGGKKNACPCSEGDTIGCGILFTEPAGTCRRKNQKVIVYFTKNGEAFKNGIFNQSPGGFYPAVGLESSGCSVEVNTTCAVPPLPDAEAWLQKVKSAFGGLFIDDLPKSTGPKHEDGTTEGCYRFSDVIGVPKDDIITPKEKIKDYGKLIQYLSPLTPEMPLFTMEIIDGDKTGEVCIGITRNEQSVGCLPGSLVDSVGYCSTGKVLAGSGSTVDTVAFTQGDIIGCYIEYFDSVKCVQFIKNGQLVGMAQLSGTDSDLYPSIGFQGDPSSVRVKWQHTKPQLPPVYSQENLSEWVHSTGLKLSGNTLSVSKKTRKLKGLWFMSPQPLSKDWRYFEVTIQNEVLPTATMIVPKAPWIGITNDLGHHKFKTLRKKGKTLRMVSYLCNSNGVGYINAMKQNIDFQLTYIKKGDKLGFGVWFPDDVSQSETRKQQVMVAYICLNGSIFWRQAFEQLSGGLYPFICLYRYGDVVSISHQCELPNIKVSKAWMIEVEELKQKIHEQNRLEALLWYVSTLEAKFHKRKRQRGQKETSSTRRKRPASPAKRVENNLNKYKVYIHSDVTRYNEATYLQASLEKKGFSTTLSDKSGLNSPLPEPPIKSYGTIVVCVGLEGAGSARIQNVIEEAQELKTPVIPVVLESMEWPPPGPLEKELSMLTLDRIEMQTDFYWGCDQVGEYIQKLDSKGYNGQDVTVKTGKGATQLYTDAQEGKKTTNEKSNPEALKIAVDDADKMKAQSTESNDRPSSSKEFSNVEAADVPGRSKSAGGSSGRPKSSQKSSKACTVL